MTHNKSPILSKEDKVFIITHCKILYAKQLAERIFLRNDKNVPEETILSAVKNFLARNELSIRRQRSGWRPIVNENIGENEFHRSAGATGTAYTEKKRNFEEVLRDEKSENAFQELLDDPEG